MVMVMTDNDMEILYEDDNILAINKPAGVLMHAIPGKKDNQRTVAGWLVKTYPKADHVGDNPQQRPGIVHRLDKDTSGVVLLAKTQKGFLHLKTQFQERTITKQYKAIVSGEIKDEKGIITTPIGRKPGSTKRTVFSSKDAKEALTEFVNEKVFTNNGAEYSLLSVFPKTGRTHQIRVHLNSIHHPVVGDVLYGGKKNADIAPRLMLHAYSIICTNVQGEKITVTAPIPQILLDFTQ
jgi:23S rRNA pseudouridine1911/1915/1917 synthase